MERQTPVIAGAIASVVTTAFMLAGCKCDDEPPRPLPAASASTEQPDIEIVPEDPTPEPDAGKKPTQHPAARPAKRSDLAACCSALRGNAASSVEPTRSALIQAAAVCQQMVSQGNDKASILSAIRSNPLVKDIPATCR